MSWRTWTALGLVYVVWGSTYLAIAYVVESFPPLLAGFLRFATASLLLLAFLLVRRRKALRATPRQWLAAGGIGLLLLLCGNGGVTVAEQKGLPSGLAALLVAGVPLYVALFRTLARDRPSPRTVLGVLIGFVGLGILLLPGTRPEGVTFGAAGLVLVGSFCWSFGSVLSTRISLPADPLVTTLGEMVGGSLGFLVVALVRGESVPSDPKASAVLGLGYLVVFGSIVAFTAYSWLLGTAPVSTVATYAYVNPIVAVVLGAAFRGEDLTWTSVVGGLVTVVAVVVVVSQESGQRRERAKPSAAPMAVPTTTTVTE
ncbi:MAG: rane protein [Frankiales bacterium]|nr:rane protein [Frankiales bacterium]